MKNITKKVVALIVAALASLQCFAFTACDDLGIYGSEDYKKGDVYNEEKVMNAYYQTFGTVKANHTDGDDVLSYKIEKSLYNATTKNTMGWGEDGVPVESLPYIYIAIPVEKDILIDDLALFFKADHFYSLRNPEILDDYREVRPANDMLETTVDMYLLDDEDEVPTKYKKFGQPFTEEKVVVDDKGNTVLDADGTPVTETVDIDYGDLDPEKAVATCSTYFKRNVWNSVMFSEWIRYDEEGKLKQDNYLVAKKGSVIVLRFHGNQQNDIKTHFQFIDLMIRAV